MMRRRGFTLTDLGVLVFVLLIVVLVLLPACGRRSHDGHGRIRCASNLRQIGLGMKMYANDEIRTNAFPRTIYLPDAPPVAYTNPDSPNPFTGPTPPGPNDVTAATFLILRTQDLTADVFICPQTAADVFRVESGKTLQDYSNFRSQRELSYSFQNPYPTTDASNRGFVWNDSMSPDFAIAADMNSGAAELLTTPLGAGSQQMRKLNSPNHDYDGQNVLYADGHAEWQASPFAGTQTDNIYTHGPNPVSAHPGITTPVGIIGPPTGANDSILLPTWDPAVAMPTFVERNSPITWILIGVASFLIFVVGLVVYFILDERRRRAKTVDG